MNVQIPYKHTMLQLDIPEENTPEVLYSGQHGKGCVKDGTALVEEALQAPIGSATLAELSKGKQKVTIICSDHTRPVPSKHIIPPMLREIRKGNQDAEITLLIATGMHRETTKEELIHKFGKEIVEKENIYVHKSREEEMLVEIGTLPSGAPLVINRLAVETDLLISEGFIEPHFFAGYSGGRKSVLPGVCGYHTVLGNHCAEFIANPNARTGILQDNPIHKDMLAAAEMAKLAFIVNVVLDGEKNAAKAVAGHPEHAHAEGVAFLKAQCRVKPEKKGDIVITSNGGAPLDQNMYQSVKGLTAAEAAAAPGAILILCASCSDGCGGEDFYRDLHECENVKDFYEEIQLREQKETVPDQWQVQIMMRVLSRFRIILVCDEEFRPVAKEMKIETADSLKEAFERAKAEKGADAHTVVIPDGVSVIVEQ